MDMGSMIIWAFFGAIIGMYAGSKRGFGAGAGFVGGLFLGPLALLMFFADGGKRKCPHCREWIDKKATKCPRCQSELT